MPSNVRGGAGRDAGIDRTLLMKVDSLAGGRTSTVGGGAFSMSLPFWDTAVFGAVKCLIVTSFCWSSRESTFAMLECFRLGLPTQALARSCPTLPYSPGCRRSYALADSMIAFQRFALQPVAEKEARSSAVPSSK